MNFSHSKNLTKSFKTALSSTVGLFFNMATPGSLRPLRTVRATFTAYGSGTFKANLVRVDPAIVFTSANKSSDLFAIQS